MNRKLDNIIGRTLITIITITVISFFILMLSSCGQSVRKESVLIKQKAVCTYNDGKKAFFKYNKLGKNGTTIVEYETSVGNEEYEIGKQYIIVIGLK